MLTQHSETMQSHSDVWFLPWSFSAPCWHSIWFYFWPAETLRKQFYRTTLRKPSSILFLNDYRNKKYNSYYSCSWSQREPARPPAKAARPSCFCTNPFLLCPGNIPRPGRQSFTCLLCSPPHSKVQPTGKGNISPPRPSILALLLAHSKKILHYLPWFFSLQLKTKFTTFIQSGYSHSQGIIQSLLFFSILGADRKTFLPPSILPAASFKQNSSNRTG